jgi:hypothetical protein
MESYKLARLEQLKYIDEMTKNDAKIQECYIRMKQLKDKSFNLFNKKLRHVIEAQTKLYKLSEQTDVFGNAFEKICEKFSVLVKFDRITAAYKISLLEISRRNQFKKNFETKLIALYDKLQNQFKEEVELRKT